MSNVGVLDKVVSILQCYASGTERLEPPEVAARLGLSPATAYRLMKAMAEHRLIEHEPAGYRLGVTLLQLGARVADGLELRHVAAPHMEWLRDQTSENAELHLRHGATRVPIEVLAGPRNLRPMGQIGVPLPLHVGASAMVLLAGLDPDEAVLLARTSQQASGDTRELDTDRIGSACTRVRKQGWASSDGEREPGVAAVAAPVYDRLAAMVAALVVSAPSDRLRPKAAKAIAVDACVEAARRVSRDLGHVGDTTSSGANDER